jgi:peptidase E
VDADFLVEQRAITVEQMRHLDDDHLRRCQAERDAFDQQWPAASQPSVARERAAVAEQMDRCAATVIAGGHVTALLNRLRLFDVFANGADKPIIAWSAGAMTLSDRIVLFHDSPPYGKNLAQLLDVGLGLANDVVVMPDPHRRVRSDQPQGIARFTQRMAPAQCLGLDKGARLDFRHGRLVQACADRLHPDGRLERGWRA